MGRRPVLYVTVARPPGQVIAPRTSRPRHLGRAASAGDQHSDHFPARLAEDVGGYRGQIDERVVEEFLQAVSVAKAVLEGRSAAGCSGVVGGPHGAKRTRGGACRVRSACTTRPATPAATRLHQPIRPWLLSCGGPPGWDHGIGRRSSPLPPTWPPRALNRWT